MTRKWVLLIAMTLVTIVVWTLIELVSGVGEEDASLDYTTYLTPLSATFNEDALGDILVREEEKLLVDRDILK